MLLALILLGLSVVAETILLCWSAISWLLDQAHDLAVTLQLPTRLLLQTIAHRSWLHQDSLLAAAEEVSDEWQSSPCRRVLVISIAKQIQLEPKTQINLQNQDSATENYPAAQICHFVVHLGLAVV